jgi:hypothetical protein
MFERNILWQSGISSWVFFAAWIPAIFETARTSPFFNELFFIALNTCFPT